MDLKSVRHAYRRYAPVYDLLFGRVMEMGRLRTVALANALGGGRLLEVGVGTGLSLPHYRNDCDVVAIDVSAEMLAVARRRVRDGGLGNVELREMDAERLSFADGAFDTVVAMYVMSVVPNPARCLAEMQRVCRPGGVILICNHFLEPDKAKKPIRQISAPLARWLGWRPDFTMEAMLADSDIEVVAHHRLPPFRLFSVLECRNPRQAGIRPRAPARAPRSPDAPAG